MRSLEIIAREIVGWAAATAVTVPIVAGAVFVALNIQTRLTAAHAPDWERPIPAAAAWLLTAIFVVAIPAGGATLEVTLSNRLGAGWVLGGLTAIAVAAVSLLVLAGFLFWMNDCAYGGRSVGC